MYTYTSTTKHKRKRKMDQMENMDKSHSESDLQTLETTPPPSFASARFKRKREDDFTKELNKFKEEILKMISGKLIAQERELKMISTTLKDIQQSNLNIEKSISFLTAQNEELKNKITVLENQDKEYKKNVLQLEEKIDDLQITLRKANFEVKNVPKKNNETKEDLIEMITCLSKSVGSTLNKSVITDIYRIRGKKDVQNTPIICRKFFYPY